MKYVDPSREASSSNMGMGLKIYSNVGVGASLENIPVLWDIEGMENCMHSVTCGIHSVTCGTQDPVMCCWLDKIAITPCAMFKGSMGGNYVAVDGWWGGEDEERAA
jgi:hypothetical protein